MTTADSSAPDAGTGGGNGLYPSLLGAAWSGLSAEVRRMHMDGAPVTARGRMKVEHGVSRLVRMAARLAGLPRAADAARIDLTIEAVGDGERWLRTFDGRAMSTRQWRAGDLLVERMGPVELRFRLEALDGALHYRQISAALAIAGLRIALPRMLAPTIEAREWAAGPGRTFVRVMVAIPLLGKLVSYEGEIERLRENE